MVSEFGIKVTDLRASGLNALKGKKMPEDAAVALCELYRDIARKGLIWWDGAVRNICFVKEGKRTVAKVLDQDFFWEWNKPFTEGIMAKDAHVLTALYTYPPMYGKLKIRSMAHQKLPETAAALLDKGKHIYPDPEFFMMKMLEAHGYIHFDPQTRQFMSGVLDIKHVKKVFKNIDDPGFVDPDMIKLHLRRMRETATEQPLGGGSGSPISVLPFTTAPLEPWRYRVAA